GWGESSVRPGQRGSPRAGQKADRTGQAEAVGRWLLGRDRVGLGTDRADAAGRGRRSTGWGAELLRRSPGPTELCAEAAPWAGDRQRVGGRFDQAFAEQAAQANGGTLEGRARWAVRGTGCLGCWSRVASVLGEQLTSPPKSRGAPVALAPLAVA